MNTIDFLRETAAFLAKDRPDVYDQATAVKELSLAIDTLRDYNVEPLSSLMFTSYVMTRIVEDGVEEFMLARKLSGFLIFEEEESVRVYKYDDRINLPSVLDAYEDE